MDVRNDDEKKRNKMVDTLVELKMLSKVAADIYSTAEAGKPQSKARAAARLFSNKSTHTKDMNAVGNKIMSVAKIDETISIINSRWDIPGVLPNDYVKNDSDASMHYQLRLTDMAKNLTDVFLTKYRNECKTEESFRTFIAKLNENPNEHHYARIIGLLLLKVADECKKEGIKQAETRNPSNSGGIGQAALLTILKDLKTNPGYDNDFNNKLPAAQTSERATQRMK